jgi:hypothetical protein
MVVSQRFYRGKLRKKKCSKHLLILDLAHNVPINPAQLGLQPFDFTTGSSSLRGMKIPVNFQQGLTPKAGVTADLSSLA